MKRKLVGLVTSVALLGSGVALAQGQQGQQGQQQGQMGGKGTQVGARQMEQREITGKVLKATGKEVTLQSQEGPVVQLKVDRNTQFRDPTISRANELKAGQEIRASYNVDPNQMENKALSIEPSQGGTGGSQQQQQQEYEHEQGG